jgi:sigma-B regulation protein RsbU (phosphoserine phosphatase)
LNQAVCSLLGQERYSTLFCARLNPFNLTLTYVNAGHIYPRLLRSTGTLDLLDRGGFPVGLIDSADYEQADIRLESGDLLACFSDGITEARNSRGEMWEEDDIDKILRENRHKNSTEILGKLIEAADDYMGAAEQADDITIVLLRVL